MIDCRAGCMAQETNNHVLQICPLAHKARINIHDAVLSYLGRNLRRQGSKKNHTIGRRKGSGSQILWQQWAHLGW